MALIGWWPLDGNTDDYSVNNNTGVNNNVTFVNGKIGQAGSFNGSSSYITVNNSLIQGADFSFSAWVRTTVTANQNIVSCRTAVGGGFSIFILSNVVRFDSGASFQWTTNYTMPTNQWIHLTVTKSSSSRKLFINGVLTDSIASGGDMLTLFSLMSFGASQASGSGYGNFLNGNLNDIRIYNHVLSQKEINELAKAKVLHYTFNKDESIIYDGSGFRRNATKVGTPPASTDTKLGSNSLLVGLGNNGIGYPSTHNLNIRDAITLSVWLKRTTGFNQLQDMFLISRPPSWYFYDAYTSGNIQGEVFIDGVRRGARTTSLPFDGNWYMITYTYNSANQKSSIYKNGVLQSETTLTGLANYLIDASANNFQTGGSFTLGTRGMLMDDVRIYSTALSAAEILDMYQSRVKIDNQGNLYANEFIENYEVASGLTLTQLFESNKVTSAPNSIELGTVSQTINGVIYYTGTNTAYFLYSYNRSILAGRKYYLVMRTFTDRLGPNRFWFRKADNLDSVSINHSQSTEFKIDSGIVTPSINYTRYSKVYDNPRVIGDTYALDTKEHYFIDLTEVFGAGNEPTQSQLDSWYRDYAQSRIKQNGQVKTKEFNEVGIDTIAVNGLTYKQIFETNNLMPNPFVDANSNGLFDDAYSGGSPVVSFVDGFQLLQSSFNNVYIIKAIGSIALNNNYYLNFQAQKINNAAGNFTIGFGATSSFISINRTSYTNISFDFLNRFSHIQTITETPATNPQLLLSGFGGTSSNVKFNDFYIINLTALGINQTKAQMDELYTTYRQLKMNEQKMRILKDKVYTLSSLNEGGQ